MEQRNKSGSNIGGDQININVGGGTNPPKPNNSNGVEDFFGAGCGIFILLFLIGTCFGGKDKPSNNTQQTVPKSSNTPKQVPPKPNEECTLRILKIKCTDQESWSSNDEVKIFIDDERIGETVYLKTGQELSINENDDNYKKTFKQGAILTLEENDLFSNDNLGKTTIICSPEKGKIIQFNGYEVTINID